MKTLIVFLLCPIFLLAQSGAALHEEHFDIEFLMNMDLNLEAILVEEMDDVADFDGTIELLIIVELYLLEGLLPEMSPYESVFNMLPNYLDTFSLTGSFSDRTETRHPQHAVNRMLAINDPMFPKEDTLLPWLEPVRYDQNRMGRLQSLTEGFGPRISL